MQKKVSPIIKICFGGSGVLTLYDLNYFSYQFSRRCLRQAPIVYRLIDSALIGNFFRDPFLFYLPISELFFICIFLLVEVMHFSGCRLLTIILVVVSSIEVTDTWRTDRREYIYILLQLNLLPRLFKVMN